MRKRKASHVRRELKPNVSFLKPKALSFGLKMASRFKLNYSDLKLETGLLIAARSVFRLTTTSVKSRIRNPTPANSQMVIEI